MKLEQIIKELQTEGLWLSGHEKYLRTKLFHALYMGPVEEEEKEKNREEKER